jgi:hypothetical protein
MSTPTTRRGLLLGPGSADARELLKLLELERLAAAVYGLAHGSGQLSPGAAGLTAALHGQELIHGRALASALGRAAPAAPSGPAPSLGRLQRGLARYRIHAELAARHDERGWFTVLEELESALAGAYYEALGRLADPDAATLAARILASEAQHQTLLFRARHSGDISLAVSTPVVYGDAPPPSQ